MARTVKDANLDTRAARRRLKARRKPYWRAIERGAHLGYYKGARGGSWCARFYRGGGQYDFTTLGTADDTLDSDGAAVVSFGEAQAKARAWFAQRAREAEGLEAAPSGPYTVAQVIHDYLANLDARGSRGLPQSRNMADAHILPSLGDTQLARLTPKRLTDWHHNLAKEAPRVRSGKGKAIKRKDAPDDADGKRQRRATANRVLTVLKAALNQAWRDGKAASDDAWRRVRPFHDVDSPVIRYLTEAECARLVNASAPDFRSLVRAALLTGCRYGELTALRASDFNPDAGMLVIRTSKSGKARHVVLTEEGQRFFSGMASSRAGMETLFRHADGKLWSASHQQRPLAQACKRAKIDPAISFHVLRHTHGSLLAMKGVPMAVIAKQLGHADERMTSRHYAHVSPSYVADTIRASFPILGIAGSESVVPMRGARKRASQSA